MVARVLTYPVVATRRACLITDKIDAVPDGVGFQRACRWVVAAPATRRRLADLGVRERIGAFIAVRAW
jgi:hypothetical protein